MPLISYYPLNGNGKDVIGNGPTASIAYTTFNGETVAVHANDMSITSLKGDFTISYDLYRINYTADWCTDCGFDSPRWGTGFSNSAFRIGYMQDYGYPNLTVFPGNVNLGLPYSKTIGKWIHVEIHRNKSEIIIFINGIECPHFTYSIFTLNYMYFFNAGDHKTGGGYFKNIRIYDSYTEESITLYYNLYNNDENVYSITKNNSST